MVLYLVVLCQLDFRSVLPPFLSKFDSHNYPQICCVTHRACVMTSLSVVPRGTNRICVCEDYKRVIHLLSTLVTCRFLPSPLERISGETRH